tara:strand:- start:10365 stop:11192 length:828 start_codon:yes stop_codon:yes gene_type:complete
MISVIYNLFYFLNYSAANKQLDAKNLSKNSLFICGYPRSGNSWTSFLLTFYFGVTFNDIDAKKTPRERKSFLQKLEKNENFANTKYSELIKTHVQPNRLKKYYQNLIYVKRDGRDVTTSYIFFLITKWKKYKGIKGLIIKKLLSITFLKNMLIDLLVGVIAKQWSNHILQSRYCLATINYEKLKKNPSDELKKCILKLNENPSIEIIENAIEFCSFKNMKKYASLDKPIGNSMRKGEVGDWENLFNKKRKMIFNKYAGEALIKHNYVQNKDWINE